MINAYHLHEQLPLQAPPFVDNLHPAVFNQDLVALLLVARGTKNLCL